MEKLIFLISKVFPLLTLPLGFSLILIILGIINKSFKLILISLLILYSFSTKLVSERLINFVEKEWKYIDVNSLPNVDSAVILSGEIKNLLSKNYNNSDWNDSDRFFAGIELIKSKKVKKLIFTGGINPFYNNSNVEGELLKQEALSMEVLPEDILITENVLNTYQESKAVRNLLIKNKLNREVILVTSAFHMNRASYIFKKQNILVVPYPVDFHSSHLTNIEILSNPINWLPEPKNLHLSTISLREILGRIFYSFMY